MTETVFGYLILISIDFNDFFFHFLLSFSFDWGDISNTQDNVWSHFQTTSKFVKTTPLRVVFSTLFSVFANVVKYGIWCITSNTRDSLSSGYPNTEKTVENTTRGGVFLTKFEVFGWPMKHCLECLIYLLKRNKNQGVHGEEKSLKSVKGAQSRFAHIEKFSLDFSNSSFVIRVNLLHP